MDVPETSKETSADIRRAYESGELYATERICNKVQADSLEYVDRLLADKLELVKDCYRGGRVLDLCCAAGEHLISIAPGIEWGIGIDFSYRYVEAARARSRDQGILNVDFVQANARTLPLPSDTIDLAYCFSSLYAIPNVEDVLMELSRVLAPGGIAVLDFGNSRSLNAYCLRHYTDWPRTHPITVDEMRWRLGRNKLTIVRHRSFQLLPLWAGKPEWLWPLLHPVWKRLLSRRVGSIMLDEWISSMPGIRRFAFRHLIVCRKGRAGGWPPQAP